MYGQVYKNVCVRTDLFVYGHNFVCVRTVCVRTFSKEEGKNGVPVPMGFDVKATIDWAIMAF